MRPNPLEIFLPSVCKSASEQSSASERIVGNRQLLRIGSGRSARVRSTSE